MPDIIEGTDAEQPATDAQTELAHQMHIALNNGRIADPPSAQTYNDSSDTTAQQTEQVAVPAITFEAIKEKFSYEKPEDAIREIEELRAFKAAPPKQEFKFEDETSEKLFRAWQGGKKAEVKKYLDESERLETYTSAEVNKDNAPDIIKLGMQLKYKDLTPAEIDYKFKKQFSIPKEISQRTDELDSEFEERQAEHKQRIEDIEMEKILEAKLMRPELEAHKTKLTVPELANTVDEGYLKWKAEQATIQQNNDAIAQTYQSFKDPKVIETKVNFNDEANKIQFEVQYQPTIEDLKKVTDMASDIDGFFNHFIRQDGSPDREGFLKALHFATNHEKIITSIINQAKNGTIKAQLPNNSGGYNRQLPQTQELSELDANMRLALGQYANGNGMRR